MTLTQKETILLQDLKSHEQLCTDKYFKYSSDACDGQLKNLFTQIGQTEQEHLNTVNQILGGTVPSVSSGAGCQTPAQTSCTPQTDAKCKAKDTFLCSDALSTEKHVSAMYNTSIFEFADVNIRNVLNHIQKEEQQHGEQIYSYMSQNEMYS